VFSSDGDIYSNSDYNTIKENIQSKLYSWNWQKNLLSYLTN
jgi:hypothetical protein